MTVVTNTPYELDEEENEDRNGGHLEYDTANHNISSGPGLFWRIGIYGGWGHATTHGLYDEGEDVAGTEDPRYILADIGEVWGPKTWIRRPSITYIPAVKKVGA